MTLRAFLSSVYFAGFLPAWFIAAVAKLQSDMARVLLSFKTTRVSWFRVSSDKHQSKLP
jgi:hypothetical protein